MNKTDSLDEIVDEGVYLIMLDRHPALVTTIADLLAAGQSPAVIEEHARRHFGDIQTVRNVRHVAEYLQRIKNDGNWVPLGNHPSQESKP